MYDFLSSVQKSKPSSSYIPAKMYIMNQDRRPAREQGLPSDEVDVLNFKCVTKAQRNCRARQLFEAGWTLQSIGDAYTPSIRRSTVKYWVENGDLKHRLQIPVPSPFYTTKKSGYQRLKPPSPGISTADQQRLARLAPLARQYRSGMPSTSLFATSNQEFNDLIKELSDQNVTTAEIARASNVTFRAIARRLGK